MSLVKKWEAKKGAMSIKNIADKGIRANMAQLLENVESRDFRGNSLFTEASDGGITTAGLDAATNSGPESGQGIGVPYNANGDWRFRPVALALMRRTFPDLFANKIVGVQALSTPVGLAYALRFTYDKDGTGPEAAWDVVPEYAGYSGNPGTSATLATFGTSASPVLGTSATGVTTSAGEKKQIADGRWGEHASDTDEWNQLGLRMDQQAIEAKTRKLAASFSLESAQDLKAMHGLDVEREMVNILQYQITADLDRELLSRIKKVATDTTKGGVIIPTIDIGDSSSSSDLLGRWNGERYMTIVAAIINQANMIAVSTRRGPGNFVVVSPDIATALQSAGHQFVQYTQTVNATQTMAAIGKLNGTIEVYRDQYARSSYALVGYKGNGISDAGVIFSPYIMGLENRAISQDDFAPRVGVMSRYAITDTLLGAGRYYRLLTFTGVSGLIPGATSLATIQNQYL